MPTGILINLISNFPNSLIPGHHFLQWQKLFVQNKMGYFTYNVLNGLGYGIKASLCVCFVRFSIKSTCILAKEAS